VIDETGVLIKDILKMKVMEKCKIIAGEAGSGNVITRVNVMADPDILSWVNEGEFLLTTGYFFKTTSIEEQMNLIRESAAKKLSGIGIKVNPYLESLPVEIENLANQLKFPIIEIHQEVPFSDIMSPVFKEIFERQTNILRKVETLHHDTMNVILKGGSIREILKSLVKSIENPVLVKDYHFEEFIHDGDQTPELCAQFEENVRAFIRSGSGASTRQTKTLSERVVVNGREMDRVMVPVMIKNAVYGHLIAYGFQRELTNFDTLYMESTANVIALEFLKRLSVQEVENKYKAEFFEDLVSLDEKRKSKALERANYYRLDRDAYYNIMNIRVSKGDSSVANDEEYNQTLTKVMYLIDLICREEGRVYLIANKGKKINVMTMWKSLEEHQKDSKKLAEEAQSVLDAKMNHISYKIGIGRLYKGLGDVHRSLYDADKAVEASKTYVNQSVIDFDSLGIYKIFCQEHLKEELISFFQTTLEPLVAYDRKRDTELVKTLMVYFETNGNLKKMSEVLFTHYNTVLYRINRIQEITAKNLETEIDRYGLQTALKIMRILDL
jgi:purine catabolism regulator